MNVVFISPNFPEGFRWFCIRLKENGVNVLGIGDASYEELHPDLKWALTEYYRVSSLEDYDQVYRAMGYFIGRHGRIDWVESNNEYWLELDAALRTDFNITSGLKSDEIEKYKSKHLMKEYYQRAGIPTARCAPVTDLESGLAFAEEVGYPLIVKPDNGVGAIATWKLHNDDDMYNFFQNPPEVPYVMEQFISGLVTTYDGVCNSKGEVLFAVSHITLNSIMDMVNEGAPTYYYVDKNVPADVEAIGKATLKAFNTVSRCFHLEFFRLTAPRKGLGDVGDLVALEVNMRPAGGFTPDMINYSQSADLYQIWADMVAFDELRHFYDGPHYYCVHAGRRDSNPYAMTMDQLQKWCGSHARLFTRMPEALAGTMGNQIAIACYDTLEEVDAFGKTAFRFADGTLHTVPTIPGVKETPEPEPAAEPEAAETPAEEAPAKPKKPRKRKSAPKEE